MAVYDAARLPVEAVRLAMEITQAGPLQHEEDEEAEEASDHRGGGGVSGQANVADDGLQGGASGAGRDLEDGRQDVAAEAMDIANAAAFYDGSVRLFEQLLLELGHVNHAGVMRLVRFFGGGGAR